MNGARPDDERIVELDDEQLPEPEGDDRDAAPAIADDWLLDDRPPHWD